MGQSNFSGPLKVGNRDFSDNTNVKTPADVVLTRSWKFVFGDDAVDTAICTLPANSQILDIQIHVLEIFNSGTSDAVRVGTAANDDLYVTSTAMDVSERRVGATTVLRVAEWLNVGSSDITVYGRYDGVGTAATTGIGLIMIQYAMGNNLS